MGLSETWVKHIENWQRSGQSQAAYCREKGLNANTFAARLSDYRRNGRSDLAPSLIPIQIKPDSIGTLVMHHEKGHRLELPETVSAVWLAEFWRCLD